MADTEVILLRRFAASRDAAAFAEITRRHAGLVYGAAWRVLADMDRAADVAQETFLQLTKDAGTITGSLPGWLHRVATHKAIDARRREASRKHRESQYAEVQEHEARDWKDISPHVDEGLRHIDPELREILIAHFLNGQTTRGIADNQGVSQATVSRRIEAGVNQLRGILRKRGVIVAVGALGVLLSENAAQGAPAALMTELGKMALAGGSSAAVSTAAGGTSSLFSAVSNIAAAIKANAMAVAAVAIIGVGSVITYEYVSSPTEKGSVSAPVSIQVPITRSQGTTTVVAGRTSAPTPRQAVAQQPNPAVVPTVPETTVQDEQPVAPTPSSPQVATASADGSSPSSNRGFGGMMGGFGMGSGPAAPGNRAERADPNQPPAGYYYAPPSDVKAHQADPNDSNDSNSTKP